MRARRERNRAARMRLLRAKGKSPRQAPEVSEAGTIVPVVVLEAELAGGLLPVHLANVAGELPVALPAVGRPAGGSGAGYPQLVYIS